MERNVVVSRRRKTDTTAATAAKIDGFDVLPADSEEAHVLAVDDSLVDRKVIERLLKISSFKGNQKILNFTFLFFLFLFLVVYILIFSTVWNVQWLLWIVEEEPCNFLVWMKRKPPPLVLMWEWIIFSNNSVFISCIYEFLNFCLALFYFFRAWRWIWLSQITVCLEWLATNCLRKSRSEKFHIIHLI